MNASLNTLLQRPDIWRIGQVQPRARYVIKTGFAALDQALPDQGWEQGALTELLCNEQGIGELSILAPAIQRTSEAGRGVVLVAPPYIPLPIAWEAKGINLQHVIIVRAEAADQGWVMEQAARSGACGMVVGWNMQARSNLNYQALRRLQLAAESGGTTLVLYRPLQAGAHASPAPTRLTVSAQDGQTCVHLVKRRAALMADTIALNVYPPHWAQHTINTAQAAKIAHPPDLHQLGTQGRHQKLAHDSLLSAAPLAPVSISHPPQRSSASR
jgi:cell division inhibitor SulA